MSIYRSFPDVDLARAELARSTEIQNKIWNESVEATKAAGAHPEAGKLMLPALNSMIDITTTRTLAAQTHPPYVIFAFLFLLGLICAYIAGRSMSETNSRSWSHMIGYALITCISLFVTLQIEYSRMGFVGYDTHDRAMVELLETMK